MEDCIIQNLGLFSAKAVYQMVAGNEYIEYSESCLLYNFIFWDSQTQQYFLCLVHSLTTWTACYEVFAEGGNGTEIFDMWDKMMENRVCLA